MALGSWFSWLHLLNAETMGMCHHCFLNVTYYEGLVLNVNMPQLRNIWELSLNWAIVFFKLVCGHVYGRLFWSLVDVGIALLGAVSFLVGGPELHRRGESKVGAEASNTDTFISLCSWLWMATEEPLESWSSFSPQWWAIIWNWKPYKYFSSSK